MSRMNYGPRFNSSAVDISYKYDAALDRSTWGGGWHPRAPEPGSLKSVFNAAKTQATLGARRRNKSDAPSRAEHETKMAERINKAIEILEFGLAELNAAPAATKKDPARINRLKLLDVIETLKSKCGLRA